MRGFLVGSVVLIALFGWIVSMFNLILSRDPYESNFWLPIFISSITVIILAIWYKKSKDSNVNYFNENNDGIFSHRCTTMSEHYEIVIDTNNETVFLRANEREKTYSFSEIQSWRYSVSQDGKFIGYGMTGTLQAKMANDKQKSEDWKGNGFFIMTTDFNKPEWQIKFLPSKKNSVVEQCQSWMNVFSRVFNGE